MNFYRTLVVCIVLIQVVSLLSQDSTLFQFQMEDQFSEDHQYKDYIGKVLIIVGSDREGSRYNEIWSFAIHDSLKSFQLQDSVTFIAVANVKGVPRLLRSFVRGKFPRQKNHRILMDWKGEFARIYQYEPGATNILLIDREGKLLHQLHGTQLRPEAVSQIVSKIVVLF